MQPTASAPARAQPTQLIRACFCACLAVLPLCAGAYATFPYVENGETLQLKWGDNHAGTPAGTLTWSLIPPGTPGTAGYCGSACPGNSVSALWLENAPGQGFSPVTLASLAPRIAAVLARWSRYSGLRFVQLGTDTALPINDPAAQPPLAGHIRIGVFAFAAGGGAVGYAPPPNGGSGAGDVLFDANSFYQFAPGAEGASFDTRFAPNDFDSLLLHELGHALGLAHPPDDGISCPVMQSAPRCLGLIQREPDADDIAGMQFLYGSLFSDSFD